MFWKFTYMFVPHISVDKFPNKIETHHSHIAIISWLSTTFLLHHCKYFFTVFDQTGSVSGMLCFATKFCFSSSPLVTFSAVMAQSVVLAWLNDTCCRSLSFLHCFFNFQFSFKSHKQTTAKMIKRAAKMTVVVELASKVLVDPSTRSWQLKKIRKSI